MSSYGIIRYAELRDVMADVGKQIDKGYTPIGGICFDGHCYMQAVYKKPAVKKRGSACGYTKVFEYIWKQYPARAGSNPKKQAYEAYKAREKEWGAVEAQIMELGVGRYAEYCKQTGKLNTELVMQAARFFGPNREYLNDWALPEAVKGADQLPKDEGALIAYVKANGLSEARPGEDMESYRQRLLGERR
jgi:hypothetical protein